METARNNALIAYMEARPYLNTVSYRQLFEDGFASAWDICKMDKKDDHICNAHYKYRTDC